MMANTIARGIRSRLLVPVLMLAAGSALATGQVGEPAADFNLENVEGGFFTLDQYQSDTVVFLQVIGYG
ncbi:hypothetical protein DRQ50_00395 [bacterium]|nr:MAG: hypothetical protein DRQ50_00395 [bacterium]